MIEALEVLMVKLNKI